MTKAKAFQNKTSFLTVPVPAPLMERLDAEVQRIRLDCPHQAVSRAALVRHLLADALGQIDAQRRGAAA